MTVDGLLESEKDSKAIGTTKRGKCDVVFLFIVHNLSYIFATFVFSVVFGCKGPTDTWRIIIMFCKCMPSMIAAE